MKNFRKTGYSVPEVAQILGCTPATVRSKINNGSMKALIDGEFEKGKKRRIRITREFLSDYIKANAKYFENETLKSFVKDDPTSKKDDPSEYEVHDIKDLNGAWADIVKDTDSALPTTTEKIKLLVDGRIMVCDIEKKTVRAIIDALLEDEQFQAKTIEIRL